MPPTVQPKLAAGSPMHGSREQKFERVSEHGPASAVQARFSDHIHQGARMLAQGKQIARIRAVPAPAQSGRQAVQRASLHVGAAPALQAHARTRDGGLDRQHRSELQGLRTLQTAAISQRSVQPSGSAIAQLMIHAPDISALADAGNINELIAIYNDTYERRYLDQLVQHLAHYPAPSHPGRLAQLKELILEVNNEVGNRHVVEHQVGIPDDVNDAGLYTTDDPDQYNNSKTQNCAFTTVAAALGGGTTARQVAAGEGSEFLGYDTDPNDLMNRLSDDRESGQINELSAFVAAAFTAAGFAVDLVGRSSQYAPIPVADGLAAMRNYPTGTQFLVLVKGQQFQQGASADGDAVPFAEPQSHWLYADRYGDQVFFYDYQAGAVEQHVQGAGEHAIAHEPTFRPLIPNYRDENTLFGYGEASQLFFVAIETELEDRNTLMNKFASLGE